MGIFLRSTITVAHIYVGAAEAAGGRPRRHKEEEEESHRGHPIFPPSSLQNEINSWLIRLGINIVKLTARGGNWYIDDNN